VHFVKGVRAGEGSRGIGVDQSPGVVDGVVELNRIAKFPGCPCQLYQDGVAVLVGCHLCRVLQASHGRAGVVDLT
jgi:hypothetical protein